eukprot:Pgem_evm1s4465
MFMPIATLFTFLACTTVSTFAAPNEVQLNADEYFTINYDEMIISGSGCKKGTVTTVPSPDGRALSILFDDYSAGTDGKKKKRVRKSCNIAVPVKVPNGVSIGIFKTDYRGNAYVPKVNGNEAKFSTEYFFAGSRGTQKTKTFKPGFDDDFFESDTIVGAAVVWSPCGADVNFRINTNIEAKKTKVKDEEVEIVVDTIDTNVDGKNT